MDEQVEEYKEMVQLQGKAILIASANILATTVEHYPLRPAVMANVSAIQAVFESTLDTMFRHFTVEDFPNDQRIEALINFKKVFDGVFDRQLESLYYK